jgi:peptide chain release factor subunit 1
MTGGTSLRDKSAAITKNDKFEGLDPAERQVQLWKFKRTVNMLRDARGCGTSMVSLVLTPRDQIARVTGMLVDEYGTASNIKSRVNKLSVLSAITSAQQRLKLYSSTPKNGLVLYVGNVVNEDGKEKKLTVDIEPFRPIRTSLYMCDSRFHTEPLEALLSEDETKYGMIVMDGGGAFFCTVNGGGARETLHKFSVDLPKKHGKGGQSAQRFARLRVEKRHNYVRKVAEAATHVFISNDVPNVAGLVLAGSADFKTELSRSDLFDPRLNSIVVCVVDVAYGGENGAKQALELAAPALSNVRVVREKRLLGAYFESISKDDGMCSVGLEETMTCLEAGAVHTLLVWEGLTSECLVSKNDEDDDSAEAPLNIVEWDTKIMSNTSQCQTSDGGMTTGVRRASLLEWLIDHGRARSGCILELVTDATQEGTQFCKGFGGIGALLRYQNPATAAATSTYTTSVSDASRGDDSSVYSTDDDF